MAMLEDKAKRQQIRAKLYDQLEQEGVSIPDTVKMIRKSLGYDQLRFSEYVGLSLSTLRRIEQNHDNYQMQTLTKILDKFGMKLVVKKS